MCKYGNQHTLAVCLVGLKLRSLVLLRTKLLFVNTVAVVLSV